MSLSWSERQACDEIVGALTSLAALRKHRPDVATACRDAVVDGLDADGRRLVQDLWVEIAARGQGMKEVMG